MLRVLVLCTLYPPATNGGGPVRTLDALVRDAPESFKVAVLTSDRDLGLPDRLPVARNCWTLRSGVRSYYISTDRPGQLCKSWIAARRWRPDMVYINSFFSPEFSIAPQLLGRIGWWRGAQILLAPRGEFNSGALALKSRKKRAYFFFYRLTRLYGRVVWHASSEHEASSIRSALESKQVIVRENETLLPAHPATPANAAAGPLRAVFLARISPIKGLDILLRALSLTSYPVVLDIYGPEEDRIYAATCKSLASLVAKDVKVTFCGPADAEIVRTVLSAYDVFMLPTASENFGHAIAEALSVSCPVMCTPFTPWTKRLEGGGGIVVASRAVDDWTKAIDEYASLSPDNRIQRRSRAARTYMQWRTEEKGPHVFDLIRRDFRDERKGGHR